MSVFSGERLRPVVLAAACLAWFGLALQLLLVFQVRWQEQSSLLGGLMNFLSYFTVLSNTLAAMVLTAAVSRHQGRLARWFRQPWVAAGVTVSLLLRNLWDPQGAQWLANEILHDVMPPLFLVYWLACVRKGQLGWRHLPLWAVYPALYFGWILIRGASLKVYPYPFVNVVELGYGQVVLNALGILFGFLLLGGALLWLDRRLGRRPE
jgi:hypothetical protein